MPLLSNSINRLHSYSWFQEKTQHQLQNKTPENEEDQREELPESSCCIKLPGRCPQNSIMIRESVIP